MSLSHPQKRILAVEDLYPGTALNSIPLSMKVDNIGIPTRAIKTALRFVFACHPELRCRISRANGKTKQYLGNGSIAIHEIKFSSREEEHSWYQKERSRPFEVYNAPLIRCALISTADNNTVVFLNFHHLIADAYGAAAVYNDITRHIDRERAHTRPQPEKKERDGMYPAFVAEEKKYLQSKRAKEDKLFWDNMFKPKFEGFVWKKKKKTKLFYQAERSVFTESPGFSEGVEQYCKEHKLSVFSFLVAALSIAIKRLTGLDDVLLLSTGHNRLSPPYKKIAGMFASTMPLRIQNNLRVAFNDFANYIQRMTIKCFRHQRYPFDLLLENTPHLSNGLMNKVSCAFVYDETTYTNPLTWHFPGVSLYPLSIHVSKRKKGDGFTIEFDYHIAQFTFEEIQQIHDIWASIMQSALQDPARECMKLEYLPEGTVERILDAAKGRGKYINATKTLDQCIVDSCRKYPAKNAIQCGTAVCSYEELDERSACVASYLEQKGAGPEKAVCLLMGPSIERIICIIGILRSGACYVPIDKESPVSRTDFIIRETSPVCTIADTDYTSNLEKGKPVSLQDIPTQDHNPVAPARHKQNNLAYILYTSGTMGKPKGVCIEHRGVINTCMWYINYNCLSSQTAVSHYANYCFDASVIEIFPVLMTGGILHVIKKDLRLDLTGLHRYFSQNNIDCAFLPTPVLETYMSLFTDGPKRMQTGGEKLKNIPSVEYTIVDNYGPTENSVISTACEHPPGKATQPATIGSPVDNTNIYILDEELQLCPVNVRGQLCLSGEGLARGYQQAPGLTDRYFVNNPLKPGTKLYVTGDYGKMNFNGTFSFLGRMDNQVKIRGYRIELEEIEKVIMETGLVEDCVVTVAGLPGYQRKLCAYYKRNSTGDFAPIKSFLSQKVPDYMVPSYWVPVERFHLTLNGKIDKKKLPPHTQSAQNKQIVLPATSLEEKIHTTWEKVLNKENISVESDFFNTGGDSLLLLQVLHGLSPFPVTIDDLFQYRTIRELAGIIHKRIGRQDKWHHTSRAGSEKQTFTCQAASQNDTNPETPLTVTKKPLENVFLSGATGFLGTHLLKELLEKTTSSVYVLIRKETEKEAAEYLEKRLSWYFGPDFHENNKNRIYIITGDISKKGLGIMSAAGEKLVGIIDCVIHTAARVKHFGLHSRYEETNVHGTGNVADFARKIKAGRMFHISTTSVVSGAPDRKQINEFYDINNLDHINPYIQSKIESEKVIQKKLNKRIPYAIIRVGNLAFNSATGSAQKNIDENAFMQIIKAMFQTGLIPADGSWTIDFSFVDSTASAIVTLAEMTFNTNRTLHLQNPHSISMHSLYKLFTEAGYAVQKTPLSEFIKVMHRNSQSMPVSSAFAAFYLKENNSSRLSCSYTNKLLNENGFAWPKPARGHIRSMVNECRRRGFFIP